MHRVDAGVAEDNLHHDVDGGADAGGAEVDFALVLLSVSDEFRQRLGRKIRADRNHALAFAEISDRGEILHRVAGRTSRIGGAADFSLREGGRPRAGHRIE